MSPGILEHASEAVSFYPSSPYVTTRTVNSLGLSVCAESHHFAALRVPGSNTDFGYAPEDGCTAHEAGYSDWLGHPSGVSPSIRCMGFRVLYVKRFRFRFRLQGLGFTTLVSSMHYPCCDLGPLLLKLPDI